MLEQIRDTLDLPILYVSHAMDEVARLATTVVMIDAGKVVRIGPPDSVFAEAGAGGPDAGAVLAASVAGQTPTDGVTHLAFEGGQLAVGWFEAEIGTPVRVRVPAREVMLALEKPQNISALNTLEATIIDIAPMDGAVDVGLDVTGTRLLARVSRLSARTMNLQKGMPVFAVIKAVAVER